MNNTEFIYALLTLLGLLFLILVFFMIMEELQHIDLSFHKRAITAMSIVIVCILLIMIGTLSYPRYSSISQSRLISFLISQSPSFC